MRLTHYMDLNDWKSLPFTLVARIKRALDGTELMIEFASNVENQLRVRGQHTLANEFCEELAATEPMTARELEYSIVGDAIGVLFGQEA